MSLLTHVYDLENRLVETSGTRNVSMLYDPLGRLFSVESGTTTTEFLYDGNALVAEYVGGVMTRRYVHNVGADVPLVSYAGATLTQPSHLHSDHQGSIVAVSDTTGNAAPNSYDEYGVAATTNVGRFQYTGQIIIPELGWYYYKARFYSPGLGRFMQTDPIGYDGGINLYAYVGNDPISLLDPTGECAVVDGQEYGVCGNGRDERAYVEARLAMMINLSLAKQTGLQSSDVSASASLLSKTMTQCLEDWAGLIPSPTGSVLSRRLSTSATRLRFKVKISGVTTYLIP